MVLSIIRLSYRIWLREKLVRRISKHHHDKTCSLIIIKFTLLIQIRGEKI